MHIFFQNLFSVDGKERKKRDYSHGMKERISALLDEHKKRERSVTLTRTLCIEIQALKNPFEKKVATL